MTDLIADFDSIDLVTVLDFIDSPATRHEVEVAVLRARERRIDKAMDAEITAARFSPSTVITAWIQEKERSGDSARRNYPREITAWAAFLEGGPAAVGVISSQSTDGAVLDDSSRLLKNSPGSELNTPVSDSGVRNSKSR